MKEPVAAEYELLHENLVLSTYLHLASNRELTNAAQLAALDGFRC